MFIDVKKMALEAKVLEGEMILSERLPAHVLNSVMMHYKIDVLPLERMYLLSIQEKADISAQCQRCSESMSIHFYNESQVSICEKEAMCEKYYAQYDVILAPDAKVSLEELLTDNLHLHLPQMHENIEECSKIHAK